MDADHSKNTLLYTQLRRALQSGRFLPGQRIDPATLAVEFHTSPTPVRFALYRLVGEEMVADHARAGMFVPLPTELGLRDLFDWMQRLLLIACGIGFAPGADAEPPARAAAGGADIPKATWQLFDAIARATGQRSLHQAVRRTNDRLAPVRRAMQLHDVVPDAAGELDALRSAWRDRDRDPGALSSGIDAYHARRKEMVPRIVALLTERREYPN